MKAVFEIETKSSLANDADVCVRAGCYNFGSYVVTLPNAPDASYRVCPEDLHVAVSLLIDKAKEWEKAEGVG